MNASKQSNKTNKELQNFMFKMLQDRNAVAAKCSLDVLVSLYKKKVWEDAKTVNVIASACFAPEGKVRSTALNFFLGVDDEQVPCIKGRRHLPRPLPFHRVLIFLPHGS